MQPLSALALFGQGIGSVWCNQQQPQIYPNPRPPEPALVRIEELGFCNLYLILHEQTRSLPSIRAVADFLVDLLLTHRKTIEG